MGAITVVSPHLWSYATESMAVYTLRCVIRHESSASGLGGHALIKWLSVLQNLQPAAESRDSLTLRMWSNGTLLLMPGIRKPVPKQAFVAKLSTSKCKCDSLMQHE